MKKYSFLVYQPEYDKFLKDVQDLGVLHVIEKQDQLTEDLHQKFTLIKKIDNIIKEFKKREVEPGEQDHSKDGLKILNEIDELKAEKDKAGQDLAAIKKEQSTLEPWGDFSIETIDKLYENNVFIRFFICGSKSYNHDWEKDFDALKINEGSGLVYFVIPAKSKTDKIDIDAEEIPAFKNSLSDLKNRQEELEKKAAGIDEKLNHIAATCLEELEQSKSFIEDSSAFEKVMQNTQKEAEEKIMLLEGWVPKTSVEQVNKYLEDKSVVYLENKPEEEDEPPILLKNNWFSRLFEPIGRMFMFPTYAEMDLTPFFAPFFMLFFGFCLGDAGYGVVLFLGATLYKFKAKKELKPILTLGQFLAVATVIFGILSGTIFGMNLIEEESQILDQEMKKKLFDPDEMFIFALILGAIQIVFGMIIRVFNITKQKSFFHAINTIGWLVLIFGGVSVFALKHFEYINGWTPHIYPVLGVAGILILFFNNKNPLLSFGSGLYNVYNTVTGIMGDLLSYIRLFALGLSSAILGYVFNDLALQLLNMPPVIGHLFFVILLLFGHTLNLLLASLGAFVHPMRLTFVEFYKNTGFVGGGKEYKPFKKIN